MPIYEFQCRACGSHFERLTRMNQAAPSCPECASDDVGKRVSRTGFRLKGGGWYATDYGNKSGSDTAESSPSTTASDTSATTSGGCGCGSGGCAH